MPSSPQEASTPDTVRGAGTTALSHAQQLTIADMTYQLSRSSTEYIRHLLFEYLERYQLALHYPDLNNELFYRASLEVIDRALADRRARVENEATLDPPDPPTTSTLANNGGDGGDSAPIERINESPPRHVSHVNELHTVFNGQKVVLQLQSTYDALYLLCQTERGSYRRSLFQLIVRHARSIDSLEFHRSRGNFEGVPFGLKLASDSVRPNLQIIFERKEE
jgi:hypothetical protein